MPKAPRSKGPAAPNRRIAGLLQRGLQLHQSGGAAEAAVLYEQVLALDPKQPAANHLLGVVRLAEGRLDDAIHLIARAVAADGRNAQYLGNLGVAFNAAERHQDALEALRRAVALKPDFAEAHTSMGSALRGLRRFEEAADAHRKAVALRPLEAGFHANLGNSLEDAGQLHEAEASYSEAIRLRPSHVGAMAGRSRVLQALRRYDEALEQARSAVARNPGRTEASMALARALTRVGRLQEASTVYRGVIESAPDDGDARFSLSHLTWHRERDSSFREMERILADEGLMRDSRVRAGFGLGKALRDVGEHAESVATYQAANALRYQEVAADTRREIAELQDISAAFASLGQGVETGYRGYDPIFIVGLPRAGKSTVEGILSGHPALWGGGELSELKRLVLGLAPTRTALVSRILPAQVVGAPLTDLGERYSRYVQRLAPAGARAVDTTPPNFMLIGFIRLALPNAKIIHCVRDPFQQCVAIFEKLFGQGGYGYSYDLVELAAYFVAYRQMMANWHRLYPGAILDLDAAAIRLAPATALQQVAAFCELGIDDHLDALFESEPLFDDPGRALVERRWYDQLDAYKPLLEPLLASIPLPERPGRPRP